MPPDREVSVGSVFLRPARPEDCQLVWEWRNDPDTRQASFQTEPIPFERHRTWFEARLDSPDLRFFIVQTADGKGIGYVRFQLKDSEAEVSIALDARARGKGYGTMAIRAASEAVLSGGGVRRLVALIKHSNPQSREVFQRAGFELRGSRRVASEEAWEMIRESSEG